MVSSANGGGGGIRGGGASLCCSFLIRSAIMSAIISLPSSVTLVASADLGVSASTPCGTGLVIYE